MDSPSLEELAVVSIHDHELPYRRDFDLQDILEALGSWVDGVFQAFAQDIDPQTVTLEELRQRFPVSRTELVIRILDGSIFEVYAKHQEDIWRLRERFADVRLEDNTHYF